MIEVEVKGVRHAPSALAELIDATLNGPGDDDPDTSVAETGKFVRTQQAEAQIARGSWQDIETVPFETFDDADRNWTDV